MARICLVLLPFAAVLTAQTPGPRTVAGDFQIDSITVEGSRIPSAAIIEASGLKKGEKGNAATFDSARDRLIATGYFDSVGYRYKASTTGGYDVTFEVQEVTMFYPVRADALPASTAEVVAYLKSKEPLFRGDRMPGTREVLQRTAHEIEQFLESHGHPQEVAAKVVAVSPEHLVIDFTPPRGLPAVAYVDFEGSKVIDAPTLHNKMNEVAFGQPYSDDGFRALLQSQIVPLYEEKGYMHVTFPKITTSPSKDVTGLDVKVVVNEGPEYRLTRVAVFGKSPEESEKILKRAKLPKLTVANFEEVRKAAERVQEEMRHQGFLDAEVTTDKKLDDEKKTVEFYLVATTGPEYTFGKLTVNGLGLDGEAAIRKMWGLKPGDSFPKGYGDYFLGRVKEEGIFDNLGDTKADQHIDADTHVVDVTLDFKYGAPKPKAKQNQGVFGPPPI